MRTTTEAKFAPASSTWFAAQQRGPRTTELPLTQDMIAQLAFEAAFRNASMGALIGEIVAGVLTADRLRAVLERKAIPD